MEEDRASLCELMRQSEAGTRDASQTYARSRDELGGKLEAMEKERQALAVSLLQLEQTTESQAMMLREKEELQLKMEFAEEEKRKLVKSLQLQEKQARDDLERLSIEVEQRNARQLEEERRAMMELLAAKELRQAEAEKDAARMAFELAEAERQRAAATAERDALTEQARETEERTSKALEVASAQMAREREELMQLVAKMKADFIIEQQQKRHQDSLQLATSPSSSGRLGTRLNTKTSLFNLLEEQAADEVEDLGLCGGFRPIVERDETISVDNFENSLDPSTGRRISLGLDFSHLTPVHALAAGGEVT
jgi:hypothetical protein